MSDKIKQATAAECIDELKALVEEDPDKFISRAYFREQSQLSEGAWCRHFGTFTEFKRHAGVQQTRHQHRLELQIARHASVDTYRTMNIERSNFGDKYLKPNNNRFKSIVVLSDTHGELCDPFVIRIFLDTIRRLQPEAVVLNGDMIDLAEFSRFNKDPRTWDVMGEIHWLHNLLENIREIVPDAEIRYVEGNHEFRIMRHFAESTPALKTILCELHNFQNISDLLALDKFEVNYISKADLSVFRQIDVKKELSRNYTILWNCVLGHHFPEGFTIGIPGWNGHNHKHIVKPHYTYTYGASEWHQLGAGHVRNASYCNGERWTNGFLIVHCDTNKLQSVFNYVEARDFAEVGGIFYERRPDELLWKEEE